MSKMTELQKMLYDKIVKASEYINKIGERNKEYNLKLDKAKAYERWKPVMEKMGIIDVEKQMLFCEYAQLHKEDEKNFRPFSGEAPESPDFPVTLIPHSMKIYAQVYDKDLLGGYVCKNKEDEYEIKKGNTEEDSGAQEASV